MIDEDVPTEDSALNAPGGSPEGIPEKFWDSEKNELRADTLLQSYVELEKRMSKSLPMPSEDDPESVARVLDALGRPASPDDYTLSDDLESMQLDAELNAILHEAGFTNAQANLVYKLANQRLAPMMDELASEREAIEQRLRLEQYFGGQDSFERVAASIETWAEKNLGSGVFEQLASTYNGVITLHKMMQTSEPEMIGNNSDTGSPITPEQLNDMVADPRYWRDKDPSFIARVTEGFEKIYSD